MSSTILPDRTPVFDEAPNEHFVEFESVSESDSVVAETQEMLEEVSKDGLMASLQEAPLGP